MNRLCPYFARQLPTMAVVHPIAHHIDFIGKTPFLANNNINNPKPTKEMDIILLKFLAFSLRLKNFVELIFR